MSAKAERVLAQECSGERAPTHSVLKRSFFFQILLSLIRALYTCRLMLGECQSSQHSVPPSIPLLRATVTLVRVVRGVFPCFSTRPLNFARCWSVDTDGQREHQLYLPPAFVAFVFIPSYPLPLMPLSTGKMERESIVFGSHPRSLW